MKSYHSNLKKFSDEFGSVVKIHKNNIPMCPIVSACGMATYNTAKFITNILQITVVRLHPILKIVQIPSRKLNIFQ